jgi:hypothetical protein
MIPILLTDNQERRRQCQGQIKWAQCQRAVTIPWLQAHSILKWIGGDT